MPADVFLVDDVKGYRVRGGIMRYDIAVHGCDASVPDTIISTLNKERADLCKRAMDTKSRVAIGWKATKFGAEAIWVLLNHWTLSEQVE